MNAQEELYSEFTRFVDTHRAAMSNQNELLSQAVGEIEGVLGEQGFHPDSFFQTGTKHCNGEKRIRLTDDVKDVTIQVDARNYTISCYAHLRRRDLGDRATTIFSDPVLLLNFIGRNEGLARRMFKEFGYVQICGDVVSKPAEFARRVAEYALDDERTRRNFNANPLGIIVQA